MTIVSISDQRLIFQRSGAARWFGSSVDVPLSHVVSVRVADPHDLKGWYKGVRLAGIQIPGLMIFGTFRLAGQLTWWDVRRARNVIIITLRDERVTTLVVEVDDPVALTRTLDLALADAGLPSGASVG